MKNIDLSNVLAAGMDEALNENKNVFSSSTVLEKLAFKRVSEEDQVTDVEKELEAGLQKQASSDENNADNAGAACVKCYAKKPTPGPCKCACNGPADCAKDCSCKCGGGSYEKSMGAKKASSIATKLLEVSAELDEAGFDKLAATAILIVDRLVAEAKAKSSKKSDSKKSDKKSKKVDMKDRMKKMREMQKGKKSDKKDDKKSSKKSTDSKKK